MCVQPSQRITIEEASAHPWITAKEDDSTPSKPLLCMQNLPNSKGMSFVKVILLS